jgi:hypothetical protein
MSQAPALPSQEEAFKNISQGVDERVFFAKLAQAGGIVPQNPAEAQSLYQLGFDLYNRMQPVKQAQADQDRFAYLVGALAESDPRAPQLAYNQRVQTAMKMAETALTDPLLYNSALTLKSAEVLEVLQAQAS